MHGEGNLLAHLVIVGYKVSYEQVCCSIYELYFSCICVYVSLFICLGVVNSVSFRSQPLGSSALITRREVN